MKPMSAAIRLGCLCASLLVGFGAYADWQFSHHYNAANQPTCSAILDQGHTFNVMPEMGPSVFGLPRGTLEIFRDEVTAAVRTARGEDPMIPVIAFHWLYPRGNFTPHVDKTSVSTRYVWDPRSQEWVTTIGGDVTALTRGWHINYEMWDASGPIVPNTRGEVERVGDVCLDGNVLKWSENCALDRLGMGQPVSVRKNNEYWPAPPLAGTTDTPSKVIMASALENSSFWWDIPSELMDRLMYPGPDFKLRVAFPGHHAVGPPAANANTASNHPMEATWTLTDAHKAWAFVNQNHPRCMF